MDERGLAPLMLTQIINPALLAAEFRAKQDGQQSFFHHSPFWEQMTHWVKSQRVFRHSLACYRQWFLCFWLWPLRDHIKQIRNRLHEDHIKQNSGWHSAHDKIFCYKMNWNAAIIKFSREYRTSEVEFSASVLNQRSKDTWNSRLTYFFYHLSTNFRHRECG